MRDQTLGRILRALRHRRGWRQADLSAAAGVARSVISDLEAGRVDRHAHGALRSAVAAVGGTLDVAIRVPNADLGRLLDADHAHLQDHWARVLEACAWLVVVEATFNHFGERGSIDLLAWHAPTRVLLVVEIKSIVVDIQQLLAGIDRKVRIAQVIARERGWQPRHRVPALYILEGSTARRRLADHAALFSRFDLRGRSAMSWLRDPSQPAAGVGGDVPRGILVLSRLPAAPPGDRRRAGRQRIRRPSPRARASAGESRADPPPRAP